MGEAEEPDVTELLRAWGAGDLGARDRVVPRIYDDLHARAVAFIARERRAALQPTELVHEAYLRLVDQRRIEWKNRAQFFGVAAEMMRRILVDRARADRAEKRSGQLTRVTLDPAVAVAAAVDVDVLDLDAALTRLAALDPRRSKIAELRFFSGLSLAEAAEVMGLSLATIERDWQVARAWLHAELGEKNRDGA
ncbi:MAG TPA: ECF-type sigma factor [Kofleriaceae bacterium]